MKRIAWIVAATILAIAAVVAVAIAALPREAIKTRLAEQISAWTGREVSLQGEPVITVFPELTVKLTDVRVSGPAAMPEAEIASMETLKGTVRLLPLLLGQVEIRSFTMVRPVIRLVRAEDGRRNWLFDSGAAALQLAFAGDVPLGEFVVQDGVVLYEDRRSGRSDRIEAVSLAVRWPSVRRPLSVSGSAAWRGEAMRIEARAAAPFAFLNGRATPVEARLEAAPIVAAFTGEASEPGRPRLVGAIDVTTPSLRRFAAWLGSPIPAEGAALGPASLAGRAATRGDVLSVEEAKITLDGNAASGALSVAFGAVPAVSGTLAFAALDLSPYFQGLDAALRAAGADWRQVTLDTDWFNHLAADVRLSAGAVTMGPFAAGDVAATASLRDGRLELGIARAALYGGTLSGSLAVTDGDGGLSAAAQLRAADVSLAALAQSLRPDSGVAGAAAAATDLTTSGTRLGDLVGGLGGGLSLSVRQGALPLPGFAGMIEALRPGSGAAALPAGGPVAFDELALRLRFVEGIADVEEMALAAAGHAASLKGSVALSNGDLSLAGRIAVAGGAPSPALFTVEGRLDEPKLRLLPASN